MWIEHYRRVFKRCVTGASLFSWRYMNSENGIEMGQKILLGIVMLGIKIFWIDIEYCLMDTNVEKIVTLQYNYVMVEWLKPFERHDRRVTTLRRSYNMSKSQNSSGNTLKGTSGNRSRNSSIERISYFK